MPNRDWRACCGRSHCADVAQVTGGFSPCAMSITNAAFPATRTRTHVRGSVWVADYVSLVRTSMAGHRPIIRRTRVAAGGELGNGRGLQHRHKPQGKRWQRVLLEGHMAGRLTRGQVVRAVLAIGIVLSTCCCGTLGPRHVRVYVSEADDYQTINVRVGQVVHVSLTSTLWRFYPSSDASIVAQGRQSVAPKAQSCQLMFHCGHVFVEALARRPGEAVIAAYLIGCGEAAACRMNQVAFRVFIRVVP